jgi:hypothetical protein
MDEGSKGVREAGGREEERREEMIIGKHKEGGR